MSARCSAHVGDPDSLRARFAEHYVGCRVRGEEDDELAEELLADAIAVAVLRLDAFERGGFGRYAGPFQGCLRDNDERSGAMAKKPPPPEPAGWWIFEKGQVTLA